MKKFSLVDFLEAVSILVGTMVGAGIFALPYVVAQVGFWPAILVMSLVTIAMLMIYLFLAEICLSTAELHHYTGYAKKYLGNSGRVIMFIIILFSLHAPLLAYVIGEGQVISSLTGINSTLASIIFWIFGAGLVYFGLRLVEKFEFIFSFVFVFLIIGIVFLTAKDFSWVNLATSDWARVFLPYGVMLFAFGGGSAIPLMRQSLIGQEKYLRAAIISAVAVVFLLYFAFAFVVAGVMGSGTTQVASIGLGNKYGSVMLILANLFAIFAMCTSFLSLTTSLKTLYHEDFKLNKNVAWLIAVGVPLLPFLAGFREFIKMIDLAGAFASGLEGIMLIAIFLALKKLIKRERQPEFKLNHYHLLSFALGLMFILGIIYTAWSL